VAVPEPSSAFLDSTRQSSMVGRPRESATLPILMYHHVDDVPRILFDRQRIDLTVSPLAFRRQLELIEANGARSVSLADLMHYLRGGEPLPERAVVLTFDDGYDDNYRVAYPLLRQFGMSATFFVVANLVGKPGYMTWEQLREMQLNGMAVESHSLDHVDLAIQPRAELQHQLSESRRVLERGLLRPVRYLNYPSGRYTPAVIAAARTAGYEAAVTVNHGFVQERARPYELSRVRIKGADTVESLAAKMVPTFWKYPPGGTFGR
jgi:peptidoglycan/xylan/chitin deacetylase (PgdA/CDA1 family)